jgi:von Willebrand factor A domain-containing protein 8
MVNAEYEYIALHRDVGETELKQGREIREGGNLVYVDSAAVRAVKMGRVLIIEGIEKAERGIMPVCCCLPACLFSFTDGLPSGAQ